MVKMSDRLEVLYFSDVLCVWAYIAQARVDTLKKNFGDKIQVKNHFIPIFGSVNAKMAKNWNHRGGIAAYGEHVLQTALDFPHITVNLKVWQVNTPTTSMSCHLFLKAIQILEQRGELPCSDKHTGHGNSVFEDAIWAFRLAFFRDAVDISARAEQMAIAERLCLPMQKIESLLHNGEAFAALDDDLQARDAHRVAGSPTFVLNDGRQKIYGNVGYRVIEANVQELLSQPRNQASWC